MGANVAPEIFHRDMIAKLTGIDGASSYMDDVVVCGSTQEVHDERMNQEIERISASGLKLNRSKILFRKKVDFLDTKLMPKVSTSTLRKSNQLFKWKSQPTLENLEDS